MKTKTNFLIRVSQEQIEEYCEIIDWLKSKILEVKDNPKEVEKYQAHLGEYEMNLENIVIERG